MKRAPEILSSYRIQLGPNFGFEAARDLVPYLASLGISHLYLSPVWKARSGSRHGYDVTDPTRINEELGGRECFEELATAAAAQGLGLILDLVPNHMAVHHENPYWVDVLEYGGSSAYSRFFDIDWESSGSDHPRVLIPCLGRTYGRCLEAGELRLEWNGHGLELRYYDRRFPLNPRTWLPLLERGRHGVDAGFAPDHPGVRLLRQICSLLEEIPLPSNDPPVSGRRPEVVRQAALNLVGRLRSGHADVWAVVEDNLRFLNGVPGDPASFDSLDRMLEAQAYRLAYWRVATESVGYRRFFDISDLVGVRVDLPEVFEITNRLVLELVERGMVAGLRLDHVDGLHDPEGFLRRLREEADRRAPEENPRIALLVEKVLSSGEALPPAWPVEGATGYDRLRWITNVFIEPDGFARVADAFRRFTGRTESFPEVLRESRREVLEELLAGEMEGLTSRLVRLASHDRYAQHLFRRSLGRALEEMTIALGVYRTYVRGAPLVPTDRDCLDGALRALAEAEPDPDLLEFMGRVFLGENTPRMDATQRAEGLEMVMRWQQITGPVMAKGLEDTAHYRYVPLTAMNEIGNEPVLPSDPLAEFHRGMAEAARNHPLGMTTTATHDTKRGEDARARLCVLSELAAEWEEKLREWQGLLRGARRPVRGVEVPDPAEEWFLMQTLLAIWPLSPAEEEEFGPRVEAYTIKAAREARIHTSWQRPDPEYEEALLAYARAALDPARVDFRASFLGFQKRIAWFGMLNGLSQLLLKLASPGTADFYQGCELWDLSLVDPDNRRAVDFSLRDRTLRKVEALAGEDPARAGPVLLQAWKGGAVKLHLTRAGIGARRKFPQLFLQGEYLPLAARGPRARHLVSFARRLGDDWAVVIAPRLWSGIAREGIPPLGVPFWPEESIVLPAGAPCAWRSAIDGLEVACADPRAGETGPLLPVAQALAGFPVALLIAEASAPVELDPKVVDRDTAALLTQAPRRQPAIIPL